MSKVFVVKTLMTNLDREKGEMNFNHIGLSGMPDYMKVLYEMLSKEIATSNIIVYEENKDVFGLFIDLKDDEVDLIKELENEFRFYPFLKKLIKHNKFDLDMNFQLALNSNAKEIPSTVEKLIILLVTSFKLELESLSKDKVVKLYEN